MPDIRNQQDLIKVLEKEAEEALENISEVVLKIFKDKYIWKYAYIKKPKMYDRTNEFADAWEFSELKKQVKTISKYLWYNPDNVKTFDPDNFIHGSIYSSPNDVRDNLPAILEGKQSSLWLSVSREEKFFQKFLT